MQKLIPKRKLLLIKLGGSIITDKSKPFTAKNDVIKRLAQEIKSASKNSGFKLLIGHGGGSFPHVPAAKYQTQKGLINGDSIKGFCETADAAIQINRIIINKFLKAGLSVASFAPLSFIYDSKVLFENIEKALEIGIMPVIYGDVIMDSKTGFCIYSGEKTLDLLALKMSKKYKIEKIIMAGDTNGVYDENGKTITKITPDNFESIKRNLGGSKSTDVTGGMLHKVEEALDLIKKTGIKTLIINGTKNNLLKNTILGKKVLGTEISNL